MLSADGNTLFRVHMPIFFLITVFNVYSYYIIYSVAKKVNSFFVKILPVVLAFFGKSVENQIYLKKISSYSQEIVFFWNFYDIIYE